MATNIRKVVIIFCVFFLFSSIRAMVNTDSIFEVLDNTIEMRQSYLNQKEERIRKIQNTLKGTVDAEMQLYYANQLYLEYFAYSSEFAYHYAMMTDSLARVIGSESAIQEACINLFNCFVNSGYIVEADDLEESIQLNKLSKQQKISYYHALSRHYYFLVNSTIQTSQFYPIYRDRMLAALDSITSLESTDSFRCAHSEFMARYFKAPEEVSASDILLLLRREDIPTEDRANLFYDIGCFYYAHNQLEEAKYYFALAAIGDLQMCVRDNEAIFRLAELFYSQGDIERAAKYIRIAKDDAQDFGSISHQIEIEPLANVIDRSLYYKAIRDRKFLTYSLLFCLLFVMLLVAFLFHTFWQKRCQTKLSQQLAESLEQQRKNNEELRKVNALLAETVDVKDRYIMDSLSDKPDFVNEVESYCQTIEKQMAAKQYDDAAKTLHKIGHRRERDRQLSSFDSSFLKLFPNFIDEYNKLFPPEYQLKDLPNDALPTEVRIFALMRLGITETEQLSKFLSISPNSVYVYKAKTRSRSLVDKTEFDKRILAIPKP